MPISATAQTPTQSSGVPTATPSMPGQGSNLFAGLSSPTFTPTSLQGYSATPDSIMSLLSQPQTSLTNSFLPYLQQLYGTSAGMTQNIFAQQGAQGAASAQSNAMKRGLTGSSIEAANIQNAYNSANQNFDQYLAQLLPQYGSQVMNLGEQDVSNETNKIDSLAQALGQQYSSQIQQKQFTDQLNAMLHQAGVSANASQNAGIFGGIGSAIGGIGMGFAMSDVRLKKDVKNIGDWHGNNIYSFRYRQDNDFKLPAGEQVGFMGHEVAKKYPNAVKFDRGYLVVDYDQVVREESKNA